jgi:ABC-type amino acid transport substrate-binding protein
VLRTRALRAPIRGLVGLAACPVLLATACGGSSAPATSHSANPPKVDTYADQNQANLALHTGRDDAVAADSPIIAYAVKASGGVFKAVGESIESAPYGIAILKGNGQLRDAIAAALQQLITSGKYTTVLSKWGLTSGGVDAAGINGATGSPQPAPKGDPKSLLPAKFRGGTITVASDASYAPIESFAKDNKTIIGLDPDLGAALGRVLGVKFKFINTSFPGIIAALKAKRFDIAMSSMTDNTDREKVVDFVDYFTAGSSIMVSAGDTKGITGFNKTLCGHSVAIEKGTVEIDQVKAIRC